MGKIASLISYTGGTDEIFKGRPKLIPCGTRSIRLPSQKMLDAARKEAEEELIFVEEHQINTHFFLDDEYPKRLKNCPDAPVVLFGKGNYDLNPEKVISIVGTRNATEYGLQFCESLIESLAAMNVLVVSGMAYGIDICAHKESVAYDTPTVGVLAHGLDRLYPSLHEKIAYKMLQNGGLVTEYGSNTNPDKERFPARNRIVAGMCDATIVIESGFKGGSLITADLAFNYNRDVLALPGNVNQPYSKGCNRLIKEQKAAMLTGVEDLVQIMGWDLDRNKKKEVQKALFLDLKPEEKDIVKCIEDQPEITIDELMIQLEKPMSKLSADLLSLEMSGVITQKPGKKFVVIN